MAELKLTNPNSGTIQLTNDPGPKWLTSTQTEGLRFDDAGVSFTTGGTSVTPLSGLPIGTELSFHKENTGSANTINAPSGETIEGESSILLGLEKDKAVIRKATSTDWSIEVDSRLIYASYTGTNEVAGPATPAIIQFDTQVGDAYSTVTTGASWKFTAPMGGVYLVSSNADAPAATSTQSVMVIGVYKNGVSAKNVYVDVMIGGVSGCNYNLAFTISLAKDDYIDLRLSTSSNNGGTYSTRNIEITRIGN